MAFTDLNFLSRFLPVFVAVYFLVPRKYQLPVLFGGSLIFYALGDLMWIALLLALCAANFVFSVVVYGQRKRRKEGRLLVLLAIVALDAGILVAFKLLNACIGLTLPLGISFYIFKMIAFQVDMYRGTVNHPPSALSCAAYFTLFFQMAQGPIMRFSLEDFDKEHRFKFSFNNLEEGLKYIIIGLSMKVLLADRLAIMWNEATKIGFEGLSAPLAWLAIFAYTFELYFDFWGYSLIASGIGVMLGFPFIENFDHPYAAGSVSGFYRRWHMTLTSWFRDYVYIPLGGSRGSRARTIANILIVWAITGFWHGGGWNFILWGISLAAIVTWEKFGAAKLMERYPWIGHLHVWILLPLTWAIFAVGDMNDLAMLFSKLIPLTGNLGGANAGDFNKYFFRFLPFLIAAVALCVPRVYNELIKEREGAAKYARAACLVALLWASLYFSHISTANPFLYFYF